jgi:4-azaleucine resistance transporter AzlC
MASDLAGAGAPQTLEEQKRSLRTRALSIGVAVAPFGFAFGVLCTQAGLNIWQAMGFSSFVFTGGSQFAAVTVLREGGAASTAIAGSLLLAMRFLAYGVVMSPSMSKSRWKRALESHLMIDESLAVGTAASDRSLIRYGYLAGGLSVFAFWNTATLLGVLIGSGAGDAIATYGIDAAIPASFVVLVWPRLRDKEQLPIALLGGLITVVAIPFTPPGVPILAAALACVLVLRKQTAETARTDAK